MLKLVLVLIVCLIAVQSIRTTDNYEGMKKPYGSQHKQYFDGQILDHFNPIPQKTWKQRYYVLSDYFEPATGPMFLYICGESTCNGMPESRTFTKELAEIHKGIVVTLEHRFYGESQPFGQDENSYTTENLKYLSQYQGLADLAYFIGYIKEKGLYGISQDTPVITVGGSYPGAMSAWFRYQYKHLTIGSYASSAVVDAIEDFQQYDMQIGISASISGKYCPEAIKKLNSYVERQLQDPETGDALKAEFKAQKLGDLEFLEMFADIFSGLVQYGKASEMCTDYLKGKTIDQQLKALATQASDPDSYTVEYLQDTAYNVNNNARQWFYQTCTAFGWFQTADQSNPYRSKLIDVQYFEEKCQEVFGEEYLPDVPQTNVMMGGDEMLVTNIVFTNGGEDPWKHASILKDVPPMKAYVSECQGCAHCVDLSTPSPSDPPQLKYVRSQVKANISLWLDEYRKELYQEKYYSMDFTVKQEESDSELEEFKQKLKESSETEVEKLIRKYVKVY